MVSRPASGAWMGVSPAESPGGQAWGLGGTRARSWADSGPTAGNGVSKTVTWATGRHDSSWSLCWMVLVTGPRPTGVGA